MNKKDLIEATASQLTGKSQKEVKETLDAILNSISEALKQGDKVTLVGFGTFSVQEVLPRTVRNPRTGELLKTKKKNKPRFKAGADLTEKVN